MATKGFTTGQAPVQLSGMNDYQKAALEEIQRRQAEIAGGFGNVTADTTAEEIQARRDALGAVDFKDAQQAALRNMMGSGLNPGEYKAALRQMGDYGQEQRDAYAASRGDAYTMARDKAAYQRAQKNKAIDMFDRMSNKFSSAVTPSDEVWSAAQGTYTKLADRNNPIRKKKMVSPYSKLKQGIYDKPAKILHDKPTEALGKVFKEPKFY